MNFIQLLVTRAWEVGIELCNRQKDKIKEYRYWTLPQEATLMTYFGSTRFNYLRPYSSTGSVPEAEEGKRVTPHSDFFFLLSRRESAILKFRQRVRSLDASHSVARGGGLCLFVSYEYTSPPDRFWRYPHALPNFW